MTPAQPQTLKTAILAETDPAFVALRNAGATGAMADFYNVAGTFVVWRTSITRIEAQSVGFDWTQVDNLTVGQARIWFDGLFAGTPLNASDEGQRAGVSEAWKGTAAKVAVATFVLSKCKRFAKRGERLFATGTGTDATPGLLTFEGNVTNDNVVRALAV